MERELWRWDAVELAAAIRTRKVSSREAVQSVLERLEAVNPAINAVTVDPAKQFERYPLVVGQRPLERRERGVEIAARRREQTAAASSGSETRCPVEAPRAPLEPTEQRPPRPFPRCT